MRIVLPVYCSLMALLGLTIGASFVISGAATVVVGLGIAALKALLIALFFMELKEAIPATKVIVATLLVWGGIFIVLGFTDYISRPGNLNPEPYYAQQKKEGW